MLPLPEPSSLPRTPPTLAQPLEPPHCRGWCPPPPPTPQVELGPSPWCQRNVMQGVGGAKLWGVLSKQGVLSLQREGVLRPPP